MAQFYCLSVILSLLCGLILIYGQNEGFGASEGDGAFDGEGGGGKSVPGIEKIQEGIAGETLFENELFRLVCGALCFVTGLVIFLIPYSGVSVFGDLIPAVVCVFAGACVLLIWLEDKNEEFVPPEILDTILTSNRLYIGIIAFGAGVIHFILPGVPLL